MRNYRPSSSRENSSSTSIFPSFPSQGDSVASFTSARSTAVDETGSCPRRTLSTNSFRLSLEKPLLKDEYLFFEGATANKAGVPKVACSAASSSG